LDEGVAQAKLAGTAPAETIPEHYVEAQTSLVGRALRTLKHGEAFAVMDAHGDMGLVPESPEGLFFQDTRHLSFFELRLESRRPLLLASVLQDDNAALSVDLTNPDIAIDAESGLPRDLIAVHRTKFLWSDACYERIGFRNYDSRKRRIQLQLRFDADFHDLFEVRGMRRSARGSRSVDITSGTSVEFRYEGLDNVARRTRVEFEPAPLQLEPHRALYQLDLAPGAACSVIVIVSCHGGEPADRTVPNFLIAYRDTRRALRTMTRGIATGESSNELFNEVACRSASDLYMLMTPTEHGHYPYAGVPWYSTVFGRDGLITAMMLLWMDPQVAKGVLQYLAAMQATAMDPASDAEPGKILHERRQGEMALLNEVPFRRYYGSVDATPLFVMLAGAYFARTGDLATIKALWSHIQAALRWCDEYGDRDGDGFVEYRAKTAAGLVNQGWKDSYDSIFHADGRLAEGPIALCEVQAYVYGAKCAAADLARCLDEPEFAKSLVCEAEELQARFEQAFWCEEIGTYAIALDGDKRRCVVRSSNAGHALFAGIACPQRARRVAESLSSEHSFSGWGIRTIAAGEARYNPMSYHNGSIWPHDNALIAMGFARYGMKKEAARVFEGLFDAGAYQELRRLPELFCGFLRRPRRGPTAYPVACSPQAWAAAAPFAFLNACLGLELDSRKNEIRFTDPVLPEFLDEVILRGLRLDSSSLDLRLHRHGRDVTLNVLGRTGGARVTLSK